MLLTSRVHKVGGSLMMPIPSRITRALSLTPATEMRLEVQKGRIIVTPCVRQPEYSLQQLVSMTDFSDYDAAWLDNEAEGAELIRSAAISIGCA